MSTTTYEAVVTRAGQWWAIEVPTVKGAHTQAKRLSKVESTAREVVALLLDVPEDSVSITVNVSGEAAAMAARVEQFRATAEQTKREAEELTRAVAQELVGQGMPTRDVATLLHVSPGWVSILTRKAA